MRDLSEYEKHLLRVAIQSRYQALAKRADPENPWQDPDAVEERAALMRLVALFAEELPPESVDAALLPDVES